MIIQTEPDRQKAKSLREMAVITRERLQKTKKEKYPSNTLTDYYDIIRKLMEALTALDGIKIKGEGAHINLINHICNKHDLGESTKLFIQQLRNYRNRISYEGFSIQESYILTNEKRIEEIIDIFLELVNKNI